MTTVVVAHEAAVGVTGASDGAVLNSALILCQDGPGRDSRANDASHATKASSINKDPFRNYRGFTHMSHFSAFVSAAG